MAKNVMIDPSLLLCSNYKINILDFIENNSNEFNFFISGTFKGQMEEDLLSNNTFLNFFELKRGKETSITLDNVLNNLNLFKTFNLKEYTLENEMYREFRDNLSGTETNSILVSIILEELIFMQEYSSLVSKSKNIFRKFKEAGVPIVEYSENAVNFVIRRTLKRNKDEYISNFSKLKALAKWIAFSLNSSNVFLEPSNAFALSLFTGGILLLDPDE